MQHTSYTVFVLYSSLGSVHTLPPRCRAGPRPRDQVLFLKTLHLGVSWLDPCRVSLAGWVLGTVASHDHIHHAHIRLTCRDRFAGGWEEEDLLLL